MASEQTSKAADNAAAKQSVATMFIENVEEFLKTQDSVPAVLDRLQSEYSKLKYLEQRLSEQRASLKLKLPEMERALAIVRQLREKETEETDTTLHFELSNHIYAQGTVKAATKTVFLWLGANVMAEYPLEEAEELLKTNVENAKNSLNKYADDLDYLKDQITITEVNIARVYNYDVRSRRKMRAEGK